MQMSGSVTISVKLGPIFPAVNEADGLLILPLYNKEFHVIHI